MSVPRPKFIRPTGNDNLYGRNLTTETSSGMGRAEPETTSAVDADSHTTLQYNRNHRLPLDAQRQRLPVFQHRLNILHLLERFQTLILVGETGSGKSTQVPQYLADVGHTVCVTQPRISAVMALHARVLDERGHGVGYATGMQVLRDKDTGIVFMTEGVLLREMMASPLLTQYSCIMLDEVHERTQLTDVLMGLLKKVAKKRRKLKLVISSATLDAEFLTRYFNVDSGSGTTSVALTVQGRVHPLDIFYVQEPVPDYVQATIDTVIKIHETKPFGDVLAFLTSMEEITHALEHLQRYAEDSGKRNKYKLLVLPMYGSLPHYRQLKVFQMADRDERKIVLATNIAETSITIPGIMYVVDCGFHKTPYYSATLGLHAGRVCRISAASAAQRAGRAARTARGECFRLYTEEEYNKMDAQPVPEMKRSDVTPVLLQLRAMGINNLLHFSFPTPPPARNVLSALEQLLALKALDHSGQLTPLGRQMAELPLRPTLAALLCTSGEYGCLEEIPSIVAMLYVDSVFVNARGAEAIKAKISRRNNFEVAEGDLLMYLNIWTAYSEVGADEADKQRSKVRRAWCQKHYINHNVMEKVVEVRKSLERLVKHTFHIENKPVEGLEFGSGKSTRVLRCIAGSLFPSAARLAGGAAPYTSIARGAPLHVSPDSCLYAASKPQWVVFVGVQFSGDRSYMRDISLIKKEWLLELAPHYYRQT